MDRLKAHDRAEHIYASMVILHANPAASVDVALRAIIYEESPMDLACHHLETTPQEMPTKEITTNLCPLACYSGMTEFQPYPQHHINKLYGAVHAD